MEVVGGGAALELPEGWVMEVRPRGGNSKSADKYYYEPETGRQFRSLLSIWRHLHAHGHESPTAPGSALQLQGALNKQLATCSSCCRRRRSVVYNGKLWKLEDEEEEWWCGSAGASRRGMTTTTLKNGDVQQQQQQMASSLQLVIPDGWIVEQVPRTSGLRTDTYFIDPMTRRKFRSIPEVLRYLTADDDDDDNDDDDDDASNKFKPLNMIQPVNSDMPHQVTWTLMSSTSTAAEAPEEWIPFVDESPIPDDVNQVWKRTFFLGMTGSTKPAYQHR